MRQLTDHIVEGDSVPGDAGRASAPLTITVVDEPGQGGACHRYEITGFDTRGNASSTDPQGYQASYARAIVLFQNGPIKEFGVNGITQEALLAIVIDRLRGFQSGQFACRDNAIALTHCEEALMWLQRRTRERIKRGVEGTNKQ